MNIIKVRAIVLRENICGESDKIITLFAKGKGKISVYCRGAKKPKSKFLIAATIFCYGDYTLGVTPKGYILRSADIIENFYKLRDNISRLSYGSYFIELADKMVNENNPADEQLYLLLKALQQLLRDKIPHSFIARLYELKLIQLCGLMPLMSGCCECGNQNVKYISREGLLCEKCHRGKPSVPVTMEVVYMLIYIFETDTSKIFSFTVNKEYEKKFEEITRLLIFQNFGFILKSYRFIEENHL